MQELLDHEIKHFLLSAARWTTQWFNKPKFHILLHLTDHIRRFGPAILFATEAFESFNAIIRAKSVHSNRHAPSRDIARAFAQGNRIRHLISGGKFDISYLKEMSKMLPPTPIPSTSPTTITTAIAKRPFMTDQTMWATSGLGPRGLVHTPNTVTQYLGIDSPKIPSFGARIYFS